MTEHTIHIYPKEPLIALVGNPNCGKTALFNQLTGARQKVANYAGVTVERKEGRYHSPDASQLRILDLPGTYGLHPRSPDEQVTCDVLAGRARGEKRPDAVLCVLNASNLRQGLRLLMGVQRTGLPVLVVLNMSDVAEQRGIHIDPATLSSLIGAPVVRAVGIASSGTDEMKTALNHFAAHATWPAASTTDTANAPTGNAPTGNAPNDAADHDIQRIRDIMRELHLDDVQPAGLSDAIDRWVLHPVAGSIILMGLLFVIFQAVFSWSEAPMNLIEYLTEQLTNGVRQIIPEGFIQSFITDGVIAGLGGVLVFLPQIIVLFFFILLLEEIGYLPRAALLLDRLMATVGLSGRSFIPLLSSFACAIPGIMATRTIANPRDRWVTILIAPLMTCSARLPVYALLIGAFIPARTVWGGLNSQGIALFILYFAGIIGAFVVASVLRFIGRHHHVNTLMLELPDYHPPRVYSLLLGLWQRVDIFLRRVGGIIFTLTVLMWLLATFPAPPDGATGAAIEYSLAGMLGAALNHLFAPIGFNWQISIALVPGLAAREVLVSSLATVYALSDDGTGGGLAQIIAQQWQPATAYALLAWFVFAPQCLSTIATIKRETGGWRMPLITMGYLFALAYAAAWVTYRVAMI